MDILTIITIGALNVVCFFVGAKVGQMTAKGEPIKMPSVNLVEAANERKALKEQEKQQKRIDTILRNIDNYDGTPGGQEDIPM